MIVAVDPGSPTPPYEQVRQALGDAIASGELAPSTRLPTVRQLAANLGLAPNTVARAYRELEAAGALETRGRRGTFVAAGRSPAPLAASGSAPPASASAASASAASCAPAPLAIAAGASAEAAAVQFARHVRRLGIPADEALRLVRTALIADGQQA